MNNPGENTGVTYSKRKHGRAAREKNAGAAQNAQAAGSEATGDEVPAPKGTVYTAEDFNLDAEYEQWKDEQGKSEGEAPRQKKGVFAGIFGKKNK